MEVSGSDSDTISMKLSKLIESATTENSKNCATFEKICEALNCSETGPELWMDCFKERLKTGDPAVIEATLTLLDFCVRKCEQRIRNQIFNREFLRDFVKLLIQTKNDHLAKETEMMTLNLLQDWATTFQEVAELDEICKTYGDLINRNAKLSAVEDLEHISTKQSPPRAPPSSPPPPSSSSSPPPPPPPPPVNPSIKIVLISTSASFDHESMTASDNNDPTQLENSPSKADRSTTSPHPIEKHSSPANKGHKSRSPSPISHRISTPKDSPRLSEHRRSRCWSPKSRRCSRQLDSGEAPGDSTRRSRSPSPIPRRGSRNSDHSDQSPTVPSQSGPGSRRQSRCQSPHSRRGSKQSDGSKGSSDSHLGLEERQRHFSSPKNRINSGKIETNLSDKTKQIHSPSRTQTEPPIAQASVDQGRRDLCPSTPGQTEGETRQSNRDFAGSEGQVNLKEFQQNCREFSRMLSSLKPGRESQNERQLLEEKNLYLMETRKKISRLLESSENDCHDGGELLHLYEDLNDVLIRYKAFHRSSADKAMHDQSTIAECDEISNDQISTNDSLRTIDKQPNES